MLKTNTKKARINLQNYILSIYYPYDLIDHNPTFKEAAADILDTFNDEVGKWYRGTKADAFRHWSQGLPTILNTANYYLHSAVDVLGDILEETEEERNRFTECDAEEKLTALIWRELNA